MNPMDYFYAVTSEPFAGVTAEEVEWANSLGVKYGGVGTAGGVGNQGDAARHVALGYLAAAADDRRGYAPNWSKNLAQLKEYFQGSLSRRDVDQAMDLHNNSIGFELHNIAGTDMKAFEGLLDDVMQDPLKLQSIDDVPKSRYRSMRPMYVEEGYMLYKAGKKADPNLDPPKK